VSDPPTLPRGFRIVRAFSRLLLRAEYRDVEVSGAERVPKTGPVVFCANHENSLVDSMAILEAAPRVASPLAKAPLFKVPILKPFLKGVAALPVYRVQDAAENEGKGARANLEMFAACRERLQAGGAIVLFPEGVSQPRPKLMPLRTGAARIALDVGKPTWIQPVGLVYESPGERRGRILARFGEPFSVDGSTLGERRRGAIASTTRRIEQALRDLLAEAESQGDLEAMRLLAVVGAQEAGLPPPATLEEEHARTQALARGYARLRELAPGDVEAIRADVDEFRRELALAGVPVEALDRPHSAGRVLLFLGRALAGLLLVWPLALVAAVVTFPARALGGVMVARSSGLSEDVVAVNRIVGQAVILFLTGLVVGIALGAFVSPIWGVAAFVALPALFALHVAWRDVRFVAKRRVRAFLLLAGGRLRRDLRRRRAALHARVAAAGLRLAGTAPQEEGAEKAR
jgi:glycerol-3-phosphate O-acyltransferase/dihydroxyacetone phosphate acyltransferase